MGKRLIGWCAMLFVFVLSLSPLAHAGYRSELRAVTEHGSYYDPTEWNAKIIWHATFFTDAFRHAFEKQHVKVAHLNALEAARFVAEQQRRQANGWDVYIAMYTKEPYKRFTAYDDSFWKATLQTASGEEVAPTSVEMIPVTPYERRMFRTLDRWSKLYRVTFPKVALGQEVSVVLKSVVAETRLHWKLKD